MVRCRNILTVFAAKTIMTVCYIVHVTDYLFHSFLRIIKIIYIRTFFFWMCIYRACDIDLLSFYFIALFLFYYSLLILLLLSYFIYNIYILLRICLHIFTLSQFIFFISMYLRNISYVHQYIISTSLRC